MIWLVSPQNPLKSSKDTASLAERMAAVRKVARGRAMIVSDAETAIGSTYTIDTLRVLKARFPGVKFVWIMGADSLASFHAGAAGRRSWAARRSPWFPGPGFPEKPLLAGRPAVQPRPPSRQPGAHPGRGQAAPLGVPHRPLNFLSSTAMRARMGGSRS
uniref:nicotinate-nucleotide adenylyltransferase n=1 Tax=Phenylobacterium glaciei TaxID=2803784 RepID=A0A974P474_9CAUL|nr:nicotinate-nucleotide adenylyltransferase [Phenylobacterium glaciei]